MKRAAAETASMEETQLFWTVTAWTFSGRPQLRAVTRAMFGAEKLCPTQPAMRPSTDSLGSLARWTVASTAIFRRVSGLTEESAREMCPTGVRAPAHRTIFLASANIEVPPGTAV